MKIAFFFLFGFLCFNGSTVSTKAMTVTDQSYTVTDESINENTEAVPKSRKDLVNIDLTMSKINESEIFQNGQNMKIDHERSYIYIKNIKSRLPWFKSRESLFRDDFGNAKVSKNANEKLKSFKLESHSDDSGFYNVDIEPIQISISGKPNMTYLKNTAQAYSRNDVDRAFLFKMKGKNQMGVQELRHFTSKDKATPAPKSLSNVITLVNASVPAKQPVKNYYMYNRAFNVPLKSSAQRNTYWQNGFENPEVDQKQRGQHYKMPLIAMPPPTFNAPKPEPITNIPEVTKILAPQSKKHEDIEKIDKYINHIIRDDHVAAGEIKFNCFNRDCTAQTRNYRINMNNGVRQGSDCMCVGVGNIVDSPFVPVADRDRDWRVKEKPVSVSEKTFIRSVIQPDVAAEVVSTESDDSYEELLKETTKLTRVVEGIE